MVGGQLARRYAVPYSKTTEPSRRAAALSGVMQVIASGGADVLLDPNYPLDRLAFMLEETQ